MYYYSKYIKYKNKYLLLGGSSSSSEFDYNWLEDTEYLQITDKRLFFNSLKLKGLDIDKTNLFKTRFQQQKYLEAYFAKIDKKKKFTLEPYSIDYEKDCIYGTNFTPPLEDEYRSVPNDNECANALYNKFVFTNNDETTLRNPSTSLYHGTKIFNLKSILANGFENSKKNTIEGFPGIYGYEKKDEKCITGDYYAVPVISLQYGFVIRTFIEFQCEQEDLKKPRKTKDATGIQYVCEVNSEKTNIKIIKIIIKIFNIFDLLDPIYFFLSKKENNDHFNKYEIYNVPSNAITDTSTPVQPEPVQPEPVQSEPVQPETVLPEPDEILNEKEIINRNEAPASKSSERKYFLLFPYDPLTNSNLTQKEKNYIEVKKIRYYIIKNSSSSLNIPKNLMNFIYYLKFIPNIKKIFLDFDKVGDNYTFILKKEQLKTIEIVLDGIVCDLGDVPITLEFLLTPHELETLEKLNPDDTISLTIQKEDYFYEGFSKKIEDFLFIY